MDKLETIEQELEKIKRQLYAPNFNCLTYDEMAVAAGCSVSKIRQHEKDGKIAVRYPNAKKRFHPDDVDMYLRGRTIRKYKKQKHERKCI